MYRKTLVLIMAVAVAWFVAPTFAGDCGGCKAVKTSGEGFCCDKGMAYGVELTSKKLSEALAGKEVDSTKMKCPGCKKAAETSGVCSPCHVGVANGRAFHSMVSYHLAKGTQIASDKPMKCGGCSKAAKQHGFCTGCGVGFVANRVYKTKADHDAALAAHKTLVHSAEAAKHCEGCAVGLVTDGSCAACKVSFKDGKKVGA